MHWKFLRTGARSPFTGFRWRTGEWLHEGSLDPDPCRGGFHACRLEDLPYWLSEELWEVELGEPVTPAAHKVVARSARLGDRVTAWDGETARRFSQACLDRCVEHAEAALRDAGFEREAEALTAPAGGPAAAAREVMVRVSSRPRGRAPARLCAYVVDAADGLDDLPAASVAYIAARAAAHRPGPPEADPYAAERAWQAEWLAGALGLRA